MDISRLCPTVPLGPLVFSYCPPALQFLAEVSGGIPPYAFVWYFGDGSSLSFGQNVSHTFSECGFFDVTVWAASLAGTASNTTNVSSCSVFVIDPS